MGSRNSRKTPLHDFRLVFAVILFVVVTYTFFERFIFLWFKDFTNLHFARIAVFRFLVILILVFKSFFSVFQVVFSFLFWGIFGHKQNLEEYWTAVNFFLNTHIYTCARGKKVASHPWRGPRITRREPLSARPWNILNVPRTLIVIRGTFLMFHGSRTTDQGFGIQASGFLPKVGTPLASTLNPVTRITDHGS